MDAVQTAALRRASDALRMAMQPAPKGPEFSIVRTLLGLEADRLDGYDREVLREFGGENFDPRRPIVPLALLATRDLAKDGSGAYLVGTDTLEPVSLLRPYSVTARAGVTVVNLPHGDATIPITTTRSSITWLGSETAALSGTAATIGSAAVTPKHAAALTIASGQLLRQSPFAELFIRRQLFEAAGLALDSAVLAGTGADGQPTGVLSSTGVGSQSGTSLAQAGVAHMKKLVSDAGAQDEGIAFIGSTDARELLEKRERATGLGFIWDAGRVASQPAFASTTMPAASLLAGDFSRVVVALWGLELATDPFTLFNSGKVQFRVSLLCDVVLTQPGAFCKSTSLT